MSPVDAKAAGGCLCGGVRFSVAGLPKTVSVCHCAMCRRWTGGPMMALHPEGGIEFEKDGSLVWYGSSDWAERGFCSTCGTSLFYRLLSQPDYVVLAAGSLDDAAALTRIDSHIFVDEKPGFYEFADDATRRTGAEVIAEFIGGEQ